MLSSLSIVERKLLNFIFDYISRGFKYLLTRHCAPVDGIN